MAIYHFNMHSNKCGSSSAIAHAAYVSACSLLSERTGETADYSKKQDVVFSETTFPDGVNMTGEELWNQVEKQIQTTGRNYGKAGDFAIPLEWLKDKTDEEIIGIVRSFMNENFISRGHPVTWAFHKKEGNPHIDYFVPALKFDENKKLVAPRMKSVFANAIAENGSYYYDPEKPVYDRSDPSTAQYRFPVIDKKTGEQKVRVRKGGTEKMWHRVDIENDSLSSRDFLLQLRQSWQDIANQHLDEEHQIDCRSYEAQGIDKEPQIHISPAVKAMEEKNPGSTEKLTRNEKIKERNSLRESIRQALDELKEKRLNVIRTFLERLHKPSQSRVEPEKEKGVPAWKPTEKDRQKVAEKQMLWFQKNKPNIKQESDKER